LVSLFLGLSWKDDIFQLNNKAALPALFGAYLAAGLFNLCRGQYRRRTGMVVRNLVAGGMGLILFFVINILFRKLTGDYR
jgi:hypothetical protein